MKPLHWRLIPFFIFLVMVILLWKGLELDPRNLPSAKIDQNLPNFNLNSLENKPFNPQVMLGEPFLLNVWASWCLSCADEQETLMKLASQGIVIWGLNYKDNPDDAKQWLSEWGNPYKAVGEDIDGKTAIDLGVYGAPETFLIDKNGVIKYRHVGVLTGRVWEKEFLPRLNDLKAAA